MPTPPGRVASNPSALAAITAHYPVAYTTSKWALRACRRSYLATATVGRDDGTGAQQHPGQHHPIPGSSKPR